MIHLFIRSRFGARKPAPATANRSTRSLRGQSLVEFALVLPMLLVMLLGLADFGRVFSAGITLEAAARNGAEAAAQEYVQMVRNLPVGTFLDANDFDHLHDVAIDAVCRESETLPGQTESGGVCTLPTTAVCVHDGNDMDCGAEAGSAPAACQRVKSAWDPANNGAAPLGNSPLPYVEVRVCYQFSTLFNLSDLQLPFGWGLSLGNIWLERDREFAVANY